LELNKTSGFVFIWFAKAIAVVLCFTLNALSPRQCTLNLKSSRNGKSSLRGFDFSGRQYGRTGLQGTIGGRVDLVLVVGSDNLEVVVVVEDVVAAGAAALVLQEGAEVVEMVVAGAAIVGIVDAGTPAVVGIKVEVIVAEAAIEGIDDANTSVVLTKEAADTAVVGMSTAGTAGEKVV
jgi:hypothetical protein